MITFLPHTLFKKSAYSLDDSRLPNQVKEACQILDTLEKMDEGKVRVPWSNHPSVKMWRGFEGALCTYIVSVHEEYKRRENRTHSSFLSHLSAIEFWRDFHLIEFPQWIGDTRLHSSHRAILLGKDFEYYSRFGWKETPQYKIRNRLGREQLPYFWPTEQGY